IYASVINGNITSNDILTESGLVNQFGVSKSPVREALIILCEEGMLKSIPRMGYKVMQLLPGQVEELTDARYALEPFLLKHGWDHIGNAELSKLENHLMVSKRDELINTTVLANWERNSAFHLLIAGFAKNDYLLSMLDRTLRACARASTQYFFHTRNIPHGEHDLHDDMLDALRQKDLERALTILNEDIHQIV
ncbi:MAG: GntR family transcriptional regulator, partial [Clostridia bacterium]